MRAHIIIILLMISHLALASTEGIYQQGVNPKFKAGSVEVDRNELLRSADRNVTSYLEHVGWGRKKYAAFMEAYGNIMSAIQKGNISERSYDRSWVDSTGAITNSTSKGFDANGAVCHFLNLILDDLIARSYSYGQ